MDFAKIKFKMPENYQPDFCMLLATRASWEFFREYKNIVYEESFVELVDYHIKNYKTEVLKRISSVDPKFTIKKIKIENILPCILQDKIKKSDYNNYLKNNLQAFFHCYAELKSQIRDLCKSIPTEKLYSDERLDSCMNHLAKLVIDSLEILQAYEEFNNIPVYRSIGINRRLQGYELFWFTNNLSNGYIDYTNNAYYSSLAYLLRDSVEIKLKNALGIQEILNNETSIRITSNIFIDFVCDNPNISLPSSITKNLLKKIFTWCNYHIHMGIVLYEWQYLLIYEYLIPLFSTGKTETQWSIAGAISMKKDYYENNLKEDLRNFLLTININTTEIIITKTPEAMLLKT